MSGEIQANCSLISFIAQQMKTVHSPETNQNAFHKFIVKNTKG